jgi:MFS family permease
LRPVLRRQLRPLSIPGFRLLFFSSLGSSMGTLLAAVALAVDVQQRTGSGLWVAALMVVEFAPMIVIGLTLGPLVDRLSRRSLMIGSDLVRAAVFFGLPFAPNAATIVALAAVAGLATGFFKPAAGAGLPNLVPAEQLAQANGLLQTVENLSWAVGPVIGGALTAAAGPHAAYWINGATFLVSAALVSGIAPRLLQSTTALTRGHWRDLAEGLSAVATSRALLTVLVAWTIAQLGAGIVNVGEIFLAKDTFHAGDFGYGLVFTAIGTGLVVGGLAAAPVEERFGVGRLYAFSLALMGAGFVAAALSPDIWVASVFAAIGGIGNGGALVCNMVLVQRGASDAVRGRAFTMIWSVNFVATGAGMFAAGVIVDAVGARWAWSTAGGVLVAAAIAAYVLTRGVVLLRPAEVRPATEAELTYLPVERAG